MYHSHSIRLSSIFIALATAIFLPNTYAESPDDWFNQAQQSLKHALGKTPNTNTAKNIILFVGDGMNITTITAARILQGQQQGYSGEEHKLAMEQMNYVGLAKTYNVDLQVPDSAGTMTAIITGYKTRGGIISLNQHAERGNCNSSQGTALPTLLEQMEQQHYATGIISTARITHATPAATYAHSPERNWESVAEGDCDDIASQLIAFNHGNGIEVMFGGGRQAFLPKTTHDPEYPNKSTGKRNDQRNLISEWLEKYPKGRYVWNKEQFEQIDADEAQYVLGLFEPSHMQYEADRDPNNEPSLSELTTKAIDILQKNKKGYFLLVEAGRIDHAHHAANPYRALNDTIAFDEAIQATLNKVKLDETLVIVTADHGHVFTIAGYPKRGNPILGKVKSNQSNVAHTEYAIANDGLPYTTLGYANSGTPVIESFPECKPPHCKVAPRRRDLTDVDTESRDHLHEGLIPLSSETHSGEDVAIFASGPWAHLFQGVYEQNYIYHVMRYALDAESHSSE